MKDFLGKNVWDNKPIKNPTQNKYVRFLNSPTGILKSRYWYESEPINRLKSVYLPENFND